MSNVISLYNYNKFIVCDTIPKFFKKIKNDGC